MPYSLLSIAYESLFLLIFIPILLLFLRFEYAYLCDAEFIRLSPGYLTIAQSIFLNFIQSLFQVNCHGMISVDLLYVSPLCFQLFLAREILLQ